MYFLLVPVMAKIRDWYFVYSIKQLINCWLKYIWSTYSEAFSVFELAWYFLWPWERIVCFSNYMKSIRIEWIKCILNPHLYCNIWPCLLLLLKWMHIYQSSGDAANFHLKDLSFILFYLKLSFSLLAEFASSSGWKGSLFGKQFFKGSVFCVQTGHITVNFYVMLKRKALLVLSGRTNFGSW